MTKGKTILIFMMMVLLLISYQSRAKHRQSVIQMAILLDTSGSMEGLIEQAKTQLWKIVNEMALAKKHGKVPNTGIFVRTMRLDQQIRSPAHHLVASLERPLRGTFDIHLDESYFPAMVISFIERVDRRGFHDNGFRIRIC